jgi:Fungal potassium channel
MVLNGITLYSVARTKFVDGPQVKGKPLILSFLNNIRNLAIQDRTSAIVLSSMAFTLIIWIISMIFLIAALLFWVFFIAHYVDRETLTGYCRRKVETRLAKIVKAKTDKIWEKEQKKRAKEEGKSDTKDKDDAFDAIKRQPTLPVFDDLSPPKSDGFLSRTESVSTLPRYTSQPQTPADDYPSLPNLPPLSHTNSSTYSANASLLGNAGAMGQSISRPSTATSSHTFNSSYSRDHSMPSLPPLSTPANDPRFAPSSRGTPMSSAERRYSPPGSTPWRTPVSAVDEDDHGYEMQEPTLPSALRPAMGPRRDASSPGPNRMLMPGPPQRSFTEPNGPGGISRSMTPGAGPGMPRSMTPGNGAGIPRSITPTGPPRSMTPTGPARSPPRGPPSGLPRAMTPGDPMRSQTPGMQQSMRPTGGSKPRGWGHGPPGMAM